MDSNQQFIICAVQGKAVVINKDGSTRLLKAGDKISPNDVIFNADDPSRSQSAMIVVTLVDGSTVIIKDGLFVFTPLGFEEQKDAQQLSPNITAEQKQVIETIDLTRLADELKLEEEGSGDHQITFVERGFWAVPDSGFDTGPFNREFGQHEELINPLAPPPPPPPLEAAPPVVDNTPEITFAGSIISDETLGVDTGTDDISINTPLPTALAGFGSPISIAHAPNQFIFNSLDSVSDIALTQENGEAWSGQDSGLNTLSGANILLYSDATNNNVVLGREEGTDKLVLVIALDEEGGLWTLQFDGGIFHPTPGDFNETDSFFLHVTITDMNGSKVTSQITVNIQDDGPTISVTADPTKHISINLDESIVNPQTTSVENGAIPPGTALTSPDHINPFGTMTTASGAVAGLFNNPIVSPGADEPAPVADKYSFVLKDAAGNILADANGNFTAGNGVATNLNVTDPNDINYVNDNIVLFKISDTEIQGRIDINGDGNFNDLNNIALRFTMDIINSSDPKVITDEIYAIEHPDTLAFDEGAVLDIPGTSLVAHWSGNTNAFDSLGISNGSFPSGTYALGEFNNAFSTAVGGVTVPNTSQIEPTLVTVSAWVNAVNPGNFKYIVAKGSDNDAASYALYTGSTGGLQFYVYNGNGVNPGIDFIVSPAALSTTVWDSNWHYVVGTYDGNNVSLYVDGNLIGSNSAAAFSDINYSLSQSDNLTIGDFPTGANFTFNGLIDDVQIYNNGVYPNPQAGLNILYMPSATDSDGDSAFASAIVNINNAVVIEDDGPIANLARIQGATVTRDESSGLQNDDTINAGVIAQFAGVTNTATDAGTGDLTGYAQNAGSIFSTTGSDFGTDGGNGTNIAVSHEALLYNDHDPEGNKITITGVSNPTDGAVVNGALAVTFTDNDTDGGTYFNDTLIGSSSNDTLIGGVDKDTLTGNAGADIFGYKPGDGGATLATADVITDFQDGSDKIGLTGLTFASLTASQQGADTAIQVTAGGEFLAVLQNFTAANFTAADTVTL